MIFFTCGNDPALNAQFFGDSFKPNPAEITPIEPTSCFVHRLLQPRWQCGRPRKLNVCDRCHDRQIWVFATNTLNAAPDAIRLDRRTAGIYAQHYSSFGMFYAALKLLSTALALASASAAIKPLTDTSQMALRRLAKGQHWWSEQCRQ